MPVIRDAWCVVFTVSPANDFCCALTAGGLVDVDVYTYEACSAVAYQSDFRNDGAKGWVFVGATAGTTTCGSDVILGGYNVLDKTDQAQRLVDLPMHTSLTVDFTWVMVRLSIACRLLLAGACPSRARARTAFALSAVGCVAMQVQLQRSLCASISFVAPDAVGCCSLRLSLC